MRRYVSRSTLTVAAILAITALLLGGVAWAGRGGPMTGIAVPNGNASVTVDDQTGITDMVTVREVVAPAPSWAVVRLQGADGRPGMPIGQAKVPSGRSVFVDIRLDSMGSITPTLFITLFADRGKAGEFDFSMANMLTSPDRPYIAGGKELSVPFAAARYGFAVGKGEALIEGIARNGPGSVTVARVVAPGPSWLALQTSVGAEVSAPLVYVHVPAGTSRDVTLTAGAIEPGQTLAVVLYADRGTPGVFDLKMQDRLGSPDQPYFADGQEVVLIVSP